MRGEKFLGIYNVARVSAGVSMTVAYSIAVVMNNVIKAERVRLIKKRRKGGMVITSWKHGWGLPENNIILPGKPWEYPSTDCATLMFKPHKMAYRLTVLVLPIWKHDDFFDIGIMPFDHLNRLRHFSQRE
jgi:hypothetical protein